MSGEGLRGEEPGATLPTSEALGGVAVRSGGITIITRLVGQAVQLGATMVLARILTPDDFGVVGMVSAASGLLLLFSDFGFTDATLQSDHLTRDQASTLFWICVGSNVLLTLLMFLTSPLLAAFYREPRVTSISRILSVQFLLVGLGNQHFAIMRREMRFAAVSLAMLGSSVVGNGLAVILALRGLGYWSLVIRELGVCILTAAAGWTLCGWRPIIPRKPSDAGPLVRFGLTTAGSLGVSYLSMNVDKVLVGRTRGPEELGFYTRAFGLFQMSVGQFASSLHHVAVATLSRLRDRPAEYRRYYLRAVSAISFLGMPLSGILVVCARDIVTVLFGDQWSKSGELLSLLAASIGVRMVYDTNQWLTSSLGRADRRLKWNAISLVATIGAVAAGLPFGTTGVAVAYSLSTFLLLFPGLVYAGRPMRLTVGDILSCSWQSVLAALSAGVLMWRILSVPGAGWSPLLRLGISFPVYALAYVVAVVLLSRSLKPVKQMASLFRVLMPGLRGR